MPRVDEPDPAVPGECTGIELSVSQDGASFESLSFSDVLELSICSDSSEEWISLLREVAAICSGTRKETPDKDVEVFYSEDSSAYATLVWRKSKVMLLDEEAAADFNDEFGESWRNAAGWSVFSVGECTAEDVAQKLIEEL